MVQAYILVQTEVGAAATVAATLDGLTGVVSTDEVTGPYDIIVRVQATDLEALGSEIIAGVQRVDLITRTLTCAIVGG